MSYASDKLKKDFIRRNRHRFTEAVKARDMLRFLPCLTTTDKEEVEAADTRLGNTHAMSVLLDNLVRREKWPEEFIRALEECEHHTLSQEVRDAYEALRQPRNQRRHQPVAPSGVRSGSSGAAYAPPSPPAHPPFSSLPTQQAAQSAPLPPTTSPSARSALPPSRSPELQLRPQVPPEAFIHPSATNQRASPPSMDASPAPAPSMIPSMPPASSPVAAPVEEVLQSEGAQAPHFGVSPEFGISGTRVTGVPPAEIPEPQSEAPDPQTPYYARSSPEPPQPTRTPIQETSSPSCKVNPLLQQQPEETSDPTLDQARTHQHPSASSEDPAIHLGTQNITPPAPAQATVSSRGVAMSSNTPRTLVDIEAEEEYFSKPGVLRSVYEEPVTAIQPPPPCSVTSADIEISGRGGDLAPEAPAQVPPRVNTDECLEPGLPSESSSVTTTGLEFSEVCRFPQEPHLRPEPVMSSYPLSNLTDANQSRGSVNSHASGSPDDGLIDDPTSSPHRGPIEDHFESVRSISEDQGTEEYLIHYSQEPSIQNYGGNVVSSQERSVRKHNDSQHQPTSDQHSLTESILGNAVRLESDKKTEILTEKSENQSQGEESGQENGAGNRDVQREESSREGLLPALHNVPLLPAAAIGVIGVCALVFIWRLRK